MSDNIVTIALSKPVQAHGENRITQLTMREPTGGDVVECGYPFRSSSDASDNGISVPNPEAITNLISVLCPITVPADRPPAADQQGRLPVRRQGRDPHQPHGRPDQKLHAWPWRGEAEEEHGRHAVERHCRDHASVRHAVVGAIRRRDGCGRVLSGAGVTVNPVTPPNP